MRSGGKNPSLARGARSLANLKRGGRPGVPKLSAEQKAVETEVRRISKGLLLDPIYQANLQERLRSGKIQPGVEVALYYYAFGKPVETIETKQITPVRIQHEYADDK